jgi:hypothetical protein
MVLEEALEIMRLYAVDRDQDDLSALEHMVRNMRLLTPEQIEALDTFMAETKHTAISGPAATRVSVY